MLDRWLVGALLGIMGTALYQVFINTGRITALETQIIAIQTAQTKQDFIHQREMDRMADDLMQHRRATEKER